MNSIEKLPLVDSPSEQRKKEWELISSLIYDFAPRKNPVICSLNETQILIMGGNNEKYLNDIFVLDSESD